MNNQTDLLDYLPSVEVVSYKKGAEIYPAGINTSLRMVCSGHVAVSDTCYERTITTEVVGPEAFFGYSVLGQCSNGEPCVSGERAMALTDAGVQSWSVGLVRDLLLRQPAAGVAMCEMLALRTRWLIDRVVADSIVRSDGFGIALMDFAGRFGVHVKGDWYELPPLTQEFLAGYIGTTREIASHYMNHLRRKGVVAYSRKELHVDIGAVMDLLPGGARHG